MAPPDVRSSCPGIFGTQHWWSHEAIATMIFWSLCMFKLCRLWTFTANVMMSNDLSRLLCQSPNLYEASSRKTDGQMCLAQRCSEQVWEESFQSRTNISWDFMKLFASFFALDASEVGGAYFNMQSCLEKWGARSSAWGLSCKSVRILHYPFLFYICWIKLRPRSTGIFLSQFCLPAFLWQKKQFGFGLLRWRRHHLHQ